MPIQETSLALALTAELEQCPENVQYLIREIVMQVRGTTRGRRNPNLELAAMKAVADETGLDPTREENKEALTDEKIEGIRGQINSAVQASYDLTHRKKKRAAEPSADAPTELPPQPGTADAVTAIAAPQPEPPQPDTATKPQPEPLTPAEPEQALSQLILAELIKTTEPDEATIAKITSAIEKLDREQLQQLIKDLKKTRKNLQKVIDAVRDGCAKKRPLETNITAEQALAHPEQVKDCLTFRNLVANSQGLTAEQQIALLKSGIKLAKEEEIISATISMLIKLGVIYRRNGRSNEALETFEEVLRLQAENHHQKPEDIERTVAVIIELRSTAEATSATPPEKLEVTFPTPRTAENVLRTCHDLATNRKFDEGEAMADMAMRHSTTDDKFEMQKIGFQATKLILAKPSIISSLQTRQLIAASFTLERAKELELAIKCLRELLTRNISPRARETSTGRIAKISAELDAQRRSQSQPAAQPAAVPAPAPVPAPTPATTPATPPQPEKPREKSQAEIARDTALELTTFLKGLDEESMAGQFEEKNKPKHQRRERGGNPWKKEEGDSILIIPDDRIEGLTKQLEGILERSNGRLHAEHIAQTGRDNLVGMVEKGLLGGIRQGKLKTRLFKQIAQEIAPIAE